MNLCNPKSAFSDILWHLTKFYGPKVFLLTKIKPEYSDILYNLTHFTGFLRCRIRQVSLYMLVYNPELTSKQSAYFMTNWNYFWKKICMKNTDRVQWRTNNFNWRIIVHNQLVFSCLIIHLPSCEFEPHSWRGVLDTTLCDSVCQWLATGQWFSPGTPVSSTNKTDHHNITEILLKVVKTQ